MKRTLMAIVTGLAIGIPLIAMAGPDEAQKQLIQRAQDAKKKLSAAQATAGAERQKMMEEHMTMMRDVMAQMQKAKPAGGMSPQQMREWIDEHMKLMQDMMGQMMDEHHMMMQGMSGMGGHGMGKK